MPRHVWVCEYHATHVEDDRGWQERQRWAGEQLGLGGQVKVILDLAQSREACHVGVDRRLRAVVAGRKDNKGYRSNNPREAPWEVDIQGAAGEYAAALGLGVLWEAGVVPDREAGDLQLQSGPLDVRMTKYETGCLLVHDRDIDDRRFLLVTGQVPEFTLRGWCYGHEAKRPELLRTYKSRTSFWVPQDRLRPLEELDG